jgi:hypothetical protein
MKDTLRLLSFHLRMLSCAVQSLTHLGGDPSYIDIRMKKYIYIRVHIKLESENTIQYKGRKDIYKKGGGFFLKKTKNKKGSVVCRIRHLFPISCCVAEGSA